MIRLVSLICLDYVYILYEYFILYLLVFNIGLVDYLLVFICCKYIKKSKEINNIKIKYRDMKNMNINEFLVLLNCILWDICFIYDNINNIFNVF